MRIQVLSIVASAAAILSGCALNQTQQVPTSLASVASSQAGQVVSFEPIDQLSQSVLQTTASSVRGNITVHNGVKLFRLTYRSQIRGNAINASALVAVPDTQDATKGLVLYLRGSDIARSAAPTTPNAIWTTEAAVFGGNGYALVVPDYIGFGASPSPQAFLLTDENVADFRAALTAAYTALSLTGRTSLFVTGFSQGGQLSAALHRDLEARPMPKFNLRATASVAGPHELKESFERRMTGPLASDPMAIGYLAWAGYTFAWRESRPLEEVFAPAYASKVESWFGGDMTPEQIGPQFPTHSEQLFTPAFMQSVKSDKDFWFNKYIKAGETYDWAPRAPLRVVIGGADDHVDPASTRRLYESGRAHGGNVSVIELPGLNHQQTGNAAFASTLAWFDSMPSTQHRVSN
jgi:pimeloyl-ACP methyl ester carboxylesterase